MTPESRPLFDRFPGTRSLPWTRLATLPTPVDEAPELANVVGAGGLWVKRDDLSGAVYGGNKVRKLEFLLGQVVESGASDVITFGAAGSNHALATAIYGGAAGLAVHSMLMQQPNARYVSRNLLAAAASGADLHHFEDGPHALRAAARLRSTLRTRTGREPAVIPFGGTTPLSTAGFVNAGLELADQIAVGALPEPDLLYVALGSRGTAAGIALGLRAAGLATRVVAVPVVSDEMGRVEDLLSAIVAAQAVLCSHDPSFPDLEWRSDDIRVASGFIGERYARFTEAGMRAVGMVAELAGITLEGTYTGKAFSALVSDGERGLLEGRTVMFWNTYSSRDISGLAASGDGRVPARFHEYFDTPVQPLDDAGRG